jgi:esterase
MRGSTLHFSELGSGRPILILHGLLGSSENWNRVAKSLSTQFQVISVDLRNHGMSFHDAKMDYTVMADDVIALIKRYQWHCPIIMGHSMGAKVALAIANQFEGEIRKLILVDMANKRTDNRHLDIINAMASVSIGKIGYRSELRMALEKDIKNPQLLGFVIKNTIQTANALRWKVNITAIKSNYAHIINPVHLDDPIDIPTFIIKGEKSDYICDADILGLSNLFTNYEMETIPNAGHWVHAEYPELFISSVLSSLQEDRQHLY